VWFILFLYRAGVLGWEIFGNVILILTLRGFLASPPRKAVFQFNITKTYPPIFLELFTYSFYRMPKLNIPKLIDILQDHLDRLYVIWAECKNNDLCEEIERQRLRISRVIQGLEAVNTSFKDAVR